MKKITLIPSMVALLAMCCAGLANDYTAPGEAKVQIVIDTWKDAKRNRDVPVRIFIPEGKERCPVVFVSHGLWGNNRNHDYLGQQWASHGYISVHLQHPGSDTEALKAKLAPQPGEDPKESRRRAAKILLEKMSPADAQKEIRSGMVDRPADVTFAIDQVLLLDKTAGSKLSGRVDADKIGVGGHSFGGFTALAVAGQAMPDGSNAVDPRVKAVFSMSPPANNSSTSRMDAIRVPVLMMTGTLDETPSLGSTPETRKAMFNAMSHSERYLCIFEGGDHMVFTGGGRSERLSQVRDHRENPAKDATFQAFIKASSTAFWDAYLRGDEAARKWLQGDGATQTLAKEGKWTYKSKN